VNPKYTEMKTGTEFYKSTVADRSRKGTFLKVTGRKGLLVFSNIALIFVVFSYCNRFDNKSFVSYVDPNIGGVGILLQPTRPTVQVPNQMIRVYPVRKDYLDDQISYFPLTIISHRNGELFGIMPFTGKITDKLPVSEWDENLEESTPYYFSTWLRTYGIKAEFTPGEKSGIFRFSFPVDSERGVFLPNIRKGSWQQISERAFAGEDSFSGMKAYSFLELNCRSDLRDSLMSGHRYQFIKLSGETRGSIELRYAVSFISSDQAEKNLHEEIADQPFENVRDRARETWASVLGKIKVQGGTMKQKKVFYTALYRCFERMVNISEDGRYYSNYDSTVHESVRKFYIDDWIWDTYLALHPLRTILDPQLESDMIQSYVEMYKQSGWLPTFPVLYGDEPCMNGFHSTIMILDGYRKGIRNFDAESAFEGMRKNSTQATMLPWRNGPSCILDDFYRQKGFYPALRPGEKESVMMVHPFEKRQSVAVTLGHSYDDWALAQMAKELGRNEDYDLFLKRSQNYRNLWWPRKGFFMPRDEKGKWIDIDPEWDGGMGGRDYYDENNGWTYLWQVQHDIPGLIELMGGKKAFEERLDQMFRQGLGRSKYENWAKFPDFSGIVGQYSMGNEPSFHIPYLYNFTGSPWKTQKRIRMLLDTWFQDNIFGIPGDEDGGGMSAFVVFSMMGFYPVTPGLPVYTIGSPVFNKVVITLSGGKEFVIEAVNAGEKNIYVQKAWLNGKLINEPWFNHNDLINGGILKLEMGQYPGKDW
jgi:predicted alpha-1,2-mannosidase